MDKLKVKILKLRETAILPEYQSEYSAGMDLHACIDEPVAIKPMERALIATGLSIELPVGYESQIRARSGLSLKHGITVANGVGTIESDYRGEYGVILINFGKEKFIVQPNMRIAQLIISKYEHVDWQQVETLSKTKRGTGGYGSTGINADKSS
ncbi:MAG TPA: dUTP diphosphatase [Candidatus Saccharimonadales bacterium]|nr:dUTP diphosphatase [Candidatus Saccharimonadales bacterium]